MLILQFDYTQHKRLLVETQNYECLRCTQKEAARKALKVTKEKEPNVVEIMAFKARPKENEKASTARAKAARKERRAKFKVSFGMMKVGLATLGTTTVGTTACQTGTLIRLGALVTTNNSKQPT